MLTSKLGIAINKNTNMKYVVIGKFIIQGSWNIILASTNEASRAQNVSRTQKEGVPQTQTLRAHSSEHKICTLKGKFSRAQREHLPRLMSWL
jgi:hypothetical protein